jgi:uncharacterized protein (DUF58 family)
MVQRRPTLTTRGAIALCAIPVSAGAGALLGAEELVLVSIALVVLLASGAVQSASRAGRARGNWRIAVVLATSDAEVESELDMTVTLAAAGHGGATPVWLEDPQHCWERVQRGPRAAGKPRSRRPGPSSVLRIAHLESGATTEFRFSAPTEKRGVFTMRGMRLWCFDTFGLVARLVAVGPSATITVHPVPLAVELGDEVLRGERDTEDSQPVARLMNPRRDSFGDFSGLRPYVPGDRLRLLYWPALARSGELMVRDFEDSGPHRVHVVADVRALIGEPGCESVLAAVAAVGLQALAQGSVLELSTTAGERVAIGPGPLAAVALLRAIASLETPLAQLPRRWRPRRGMGGGPGERDTEIHPTAGSPVVVTTAEGMRALPGAFGFAHLVIAP